MKPQQLQEKLLAAARLNPPGDHVPFTFEKRVIARLRESPMPDFAAFWARALWRAATACVALTLLIGVWSFIGSKNQPAAQNENFSQHFEQTMLAAVNDSEEIR